MRNRILTDSFKICLILITLFTLLSCTKIQDAKRLLLTDCAEAGPAIETSLDIYAPEIDSERFYQNLNQAAKSLEIETLETIIYNKKEYPIYHIRKQAKQNRVPILVVSSLHGNETGGSLAASIILTDIKENAEFYRQVDIHFIAPANPVGLFNQSRYNSNGCDINRDFDEKSNTLEAKVIRSVIDEVKPQLIVSLHEGPQDGFHVIATHSNTTGFVDAISSAMGLSEITMAQVDHLGLALDTPGLMHEGWFKTKAKSLFGFHSLGSYGEKKGIPVLTTEGEFSSKELAKRSKSQLYALRAIVSNIDLIKID